MEYHIEIFVQHYWPTSRKDLLFTIRKNDRCYQKGDILVMYAYDPRKKLLLKREAFPPICAEITFIISGLMFGLQDNFVAMGLKLMPDYEYEPREQPDFIRDYLPIRKQR